MALGVWSHGLAGHTGIDRIRRDLIAERINWALGIAQIVIPMHFLVKILQTGKQRLIVRRILILKELHGARHTWLECGILIGLANRKSEHRVRVFRKIQQINQSRNIVKQRAENHTAEAE